MATWGTFRKIPLLPSGIAKLRKRAGLIAYQAQLAPNQNVKMYIGRP
jgi:hypothetical protein